MLNDILEYYPEEKLLKAYGFDDAILGVSEQMNEPIKLIYSKSKCLNILIKRDKMSYEEAAEYFSFNVEGAYVGEQTPIWCNDLM
tara:strand:+ start:1266 stop:1520 length:255 start_codon:yes stop_codon:yes gene_type:complete